MPVAYGVAHEENGVFGISFPDFPGCISGADTIDDVIRKGSEALSFHVAGMVEDGDALPSVLRSAAELRADPDVDLVGGVLAAVPFDLPARSVRVNISIDENLLGALDRAAEAVGQSRSAYLASAVRDKLRAA